MKIAFEPDAGACISSSSATLGTFDGVHLGHRALLKRLVQIAAETGTVSAVLTFDAHPLTVINPERAPRLLSTLDEKLAAFESAGIEQVLVLKFTRAIAGMTSGEFIRKYLIDCLGVMNFLAGYDHHLGKDKAHIADRFEEVSAANRITVEVLPPVMVDGTVVKSSRIRELIMAGGVEQAARLLGYDYSFAGTVVRGRGIGRKIGFPTANIEPDEPFKVMPPNGVYAGWIEVSGERRNAAVLVGPSPTFGFTDELIEVHVPGFESDIYDAGVRVGFSRRLRDIRTFSSREELVAQIRKDIEAVAGN